MSVIISARIKELRKKRGITQNDIAKALGISRSLIAGWEMGTREPNALEMRNLCMFFSVSSDYICGRTDSCTNMNISKTYDMDMSKLNPLGKRILFEFYDFLANNETYKR